MSIPAMPTAEHDRLHTAAFHNEKVAARRLARAQGISEQAALWSVLAQAAARAGLDGGDGDDAVELLLAQRIGQRQRDIERAAGRRAAKLRARDEAREARRMRNEIGMPGIWRGCFDGSATPNPGAIGIGAQLRGPAGQCLDISRRAGHGGSSDAEYLALIALLDMALAAGATPLLVQGDSRVVIDDVGAAGPGAKGLDGYRAQVRALMAQLGEVTLRWVPRHRNGDADRLSQQAIRQGGSGVRTA
jgi:ribonuclease HI